MEGPRARMKSPPSRYRIEERNKRLVVIDQWAGTDAAIRVVPQDQTRGADNTPKAPPTPTPPSSVRKRAVPAQAGGPGSADAFARLFVSGRTDAAGRPLLVTQSWYDARGPRTVALSPEAMGQIHRLTLVLLVFAVMLVIVAVSFPALLIVVPFILLRGGFHKIRSKTADWLDSQPAA